MIGEEVAGHANVSVSKDEEGSEKRDEEPDHLWVRVGKAKLVARLCPLGPVEHATRKVEGVARACKLTTLLLS
jgi:hypothetical protein